MYLSLDNLQKWLRNFHLKEVINLNKVYQETIIICIVDLVVKAVGVTGKKSNNIIKKSEQTEERLELNNIYSHSLAMLEYSLS